MRLIFSLALLGLLASCHHYEEKKKYSSCFNCATPESATDSPSVIPSEPLEALPLELEVSVATDILVDAEAGMIEYRQTQLNYRAVSNRAGERIACGVGSTEGQRVSFALVDGMLRLEVEGGELNFSKLSEDHDVLVGSWVHEASFGGVDITYSYEFTADNRLKMNMRCSPEETAAATEVVL